MLSFLQNACLQAAWRLTVWGIHIAVHGPVHLHVVMLLVRRSRFALSRCRLTLATRFPLPLDFLIAEEKQKLKDREAASAKAAAGEPGPALLSQGFAQTSLHMAEQEQWYHLGAGLARMSLIR